MTHTVRFMGVNRDTETAGPGKRLEFFTKGCIRGVIAPCQGCFNESTWTFEGLSREMTIDEVVEVALTSWNRQITFCGGEPILQARALTKVAKRLKEIDPTFNFVMYTAYKLDTLMKYGLKFTWVPRHGEAMKEALMDYSRHYHIDDEDKITFTILQPDDVRNLMNYIDIIVDGDYQQDKRLTNEKYMHNGWFVGSSNQRVIDGPKSIWTNELVYLYADEYNKQRSEYRHCNCCGHEVLVGYYIHKDLVFCDKKCWDRYDERNKELAHLGGL